MVILNDTDLCLYASQLVESTDKLLSEYGLKYGVYIDVQLDCEHFRRETLIIGVTDCAETFSICSIMYPLTWDVYGVEDLPSPITFATEIAQRIKKNVELSESGCMVKWSVDDSGTVTAERIN